MAGFDSQDGAGRGEVVFAHDVGRSSKVSADTNTLEDGGGSEEGLGVGDTKVVDAFSDGLRTSGLERAGQESHVSALVLRDDLDVVVDISGESGLLEVINGEVGKTVTVELVLEVLKGQGIIENVRVSDGGHGLTNSEQAKTWSVGIH